MIVLTPAEMREADAQACAQSGDVALMREAGKAIAASVRRYCAPGRIVAFAGPGNNGGDAFAALAELPEYECIVYAQPAAKMSAARADAEQRARQNGVEMHAFPGDTAQIDAALDGARLVVIGLVGTAARLPLPAEFQALVRALNVHALPAIAIDIPPGLDGGTGAIVEPALRASATVTLGAAKSGLVLAEDRSVAGEIVVAPIGMSPELLLSHAHTYDALDDPQLARMLPRRSRQSDKRSAGAPLVIAGSQQFPGAAILCAMGAARAGAGYVTVATPAAAAPALRMHLIEQVVVTLDTNAPPAQVVDDLIDMSQRNGSIAIGPGLGLDDWTGEVVRGVLRRTKLPAVADASALFHLAKQLDILRDKAIVLTPHAGEFARLSGKGTIAQVERETRLREFVDRTGVTTLLKGDPTLVYGGGKVHVNTSGTPALATAGTGDVLTGIIATLLAQGLSAEDAARAAAYWHGKAAQFAQRTRVRGVIARDVYESLGYLFSS